MNPFTDPLPSEVPLPRAPLVRVLCQLRFPAVLSVESQEFVAPFQEELRSKYPVLRQERTEGMMLGPAGFIPAKAETAWRFQDLEGDWRVSLSSSFIALDTGKYTSRDQFIERLSEVVGAAERHIKPAVIDRIGLRYVDRLDGEAMTQLARLIRPEVLGVVNGDVGSHLLHSMTESVFESQLGALLARWGRLPADSTHDANVMAAVGSPSWVLDLDMFSRPGEALAFTSGEVLPKVRAYAERIHSFFRWCVKDEFLEYYGGRR